MLRLPTTRIGKPKRVYKTRIQSLTDFVNKQPHFDTKKTIISCLLIHNKTEISELAKETLIKPKSIKFHLTALYKYYNVKSKNELTTKLFHLYLGL